jgi:hypothetical protein
MAWLASTLDELARRPTCGYASAAAPATEPTALAALALHVHGRSLEARPALDWLGKIQSDDGSVGVREGEATPAWPTSLAVIAWKTIAPEQFGGRIERAAAWILSARGETTPRAVEFGHDTEIPGWSYAEATHSWIEPTSLHVIALKSVGRGEHARTRDGVRMLIDRQIPFGGCNYGNTSVLGQMLRSHVQPTGIALLALAGENDPSGRVSTSVKWLRQAIGPRTTAASLSWALLALRAQGELPNQADEWLAGAHRRVMDHDRSPHKLALLALAAKGWPNL